MSQTVYKTPRTTQDQALHNKSSGEIECSAH